MNKRPVSAAPDRIDADQLAELLRDPDPFVRVDALGRVKRDEQAVGTIDEALADDYPLVRREAIRALSRIGGPDAARALVRASAHDLSAEVREEAVAALAGMLRASGATGSGA